MNTDMWYKAIGLPGILEIKETSIKELLRSFVKDGLLVDNGVTKDVNTKRYKKTRFFRYRASKMLLNF